MWMFLKARLIKKKRHRNTHNTTTKNERGNISIDLTVTNGLNDNTVSNFLIKN